MPTKIEGLDLYITPQLQGHVTPQSLIAAKVRSSFRRNTANYQRASSFESRTRITIWRSALRPHTFISHVTKTSLKGNFSLFTCQPITPISLPSGSPVCSD